MSEAVKSGIVNAALATENHPLTQFSAAAPSLILPRPSCGMPALHQKSAALAEQASVAPATLPRVFQNSRRCGILTANSPRIFCKERRFRE
jgi:hypothetical protein